MATVNKVSLILTHPHTHWQFNFQLINFLAKVDLAQQLLVKFNNLIIIIVITESETEWVIHLVA